MCIHTDTQHTHTHGTHTQGKKETEREEGRKKGKQEEMIIQCIQKIDLNYKLIKKTLRREQVQNRKY